VGVGAAQPPAEGEQRVADPAAVPGQLLLDTAADVVDGGVPESGDVEGVQHPHGVRQGGAQRRVESDRGRGVSASAGPFPRPAPRTGRAVG